jgi:hypothetical protein
MRALALSQQVCIAADRFFAFRTEKGARTEQQQRLKRLAGAARAVFHAGDTEFQTLQDAWNCLDWKEDFFALKGDPFKLWADARADPLALAEAAESYLAEIRAGRPKEHAFQRYIKDLGAVYEEATGQAWPTGVHHERREPMDARHRVLLAHAGEIAGVYGGFVKLIAAGWPRGVPPKTGLTLRKFLQRLADDGGK